jgi:hypothetical protein
MTMSLRDQGDIGKFSYTLMDTRKVPPDWVCVTPGCGEALPASEWETRVIGNAQPRCVVCGASMCRSPYARAYRRGESLL